jgi:L-seryl-tRNA(Ser) seleniumtransferase/D-glucosaminate-6-phosphate ammonia-lyase
VRVNLLDQLGVARVINASGRMTKLGVNTLSPPVLEAMATAGANYVEIDELQRAVGGEIARLIAADDAMVTTGAAAGISLMVAACVAGTDITRIQALPDPLDAANEVMIQTGHQVDFGAHVIQLIRLAGGHPVAVGAVNSVSADHLAGAIGPRTAAFLFIQSHHAVQKGMLSLDRCIEICASHKIPVLIDAAAEEDLTRFTSSGADLVTFSGGKAIGGPTSGIVAGRRDLVEACRAQSLGIGRPMKIGKEGLLGLLAAVSAYVQRDTEAERSRCSTIVDSLLAGFEHFSATQRLSDEAGRGIERAALVLDPNRAAMLVTFLHEGSPSIHPRTHLINAGIVAFDPRPMQGADVEIVVDRVRSFFEQRGSPDQLDRA